MKKIFMTLAIMATIAMPVMANEVKVIDHVTTMVEKMSVEKDFDFSTLDLDKANKIIKTNKKNLDSLKYFHKIFCAEMVKAGKATTKAESDTIANRAINHLEENANMILKKLKEHHEYFNILNATLINRGFTENLISCRN